MPPRELDELIEPVPPSLAAYRPSLRYFLMDEGRLPEDSLEQADNAIASLIQLERSASPQDIARVVGQLAQKLQAPHTPPCKTGPPKAALLQAAYLLAPPPVPH